MLGHGGRPKNVARCRGDPIFSICGEGFRPIPLQRYHPKIPCALHPPAYQPILSPSLHVRSQSQTNPAFVQVLQHHDPTRRHQCTCLHQDHSSRIIHWTKIWRKKMQLSCPSPAWNSTPWTFHHLLPTCSRSCVGNKTDTEAGTVVKHRHRPI